MEDMRTRAQGRFRDKLQTYLRLVDELGGAAAWEASLEGYVERQKAEMGAFIDSEELAGGLRNAIPLLAAMGIEMEVVDISTGDVDAALEILKTCPCLEASRACGLSEPCSSLCQLDVEASRRAFPGMQVSALSTQSDDGSCVCIFKYERNRSSQGIPASNGELFEPVE
jgi:hypothetical protein